MDREYFGLCEVQAFEKAEVPDCGQPEVPVYSQVTPLGPGVVEYTCTQGYTRVGPATRNCTELGWVGPVPLCRGENDPLGSTTITNVQKSPFNWVKGC